MHRLRDVFDALFPDVVEGIGQPVANMIADGPRDADASWLRQCLQPRGDVDAVAIDVVVSGDDIAKIDPDPERDSFFLGDIGVAVEYRPLDLDRAAHRIDDARKFDQHAVARRLDDAPMMLPDFRVDQLAAMRLQPAEGALLIRPHQPRVTRHIGSEDRRKAARRGRLYGLARPSAPVADTTVGECSSLGHPSAPPVRGTSKKSTIIHQALRVTCSIRCAYSVD
jgi:hypothetical protein